MIGLAEEAILARASLVLGGQRRVDSDLVVVDGFSESTGAFRDAELMRIGAFIRYEIEMSCIEGVDKHGNKHRPGTTTSNVAGVWHLYRIW